MDTQPEITWPRVAGFVRQLTHDVRNHLNGLDLETALLNELVTDGEAKESVDRLRRLIRQTASELRTLSAKFAQPSFAVGEVAAKELFLIWQDQATGLEPAPKIEWHESVGNARVKTDIDVVARALREVLANAATFSGDAPIKAEAHAADGYLVFTLIEPKTLPLDPSTWGRTPLVSTRRGGYGLGLWEADRNIKECGGEVQRHFDSAKKTLTTTLKFPTV